MESDLIRRHINTGTILTQRNLFGVIIQSQEPNPAASIL